MHRLARISARASVRDARPCTCVARRADAGATARALAVARAIARNVLRARASRRLGMVRAMHDLRQRAVAAKRSCAPALALGDPRLRRRRLEHACSSTRASRSRTASSCRSETTDGIRAAARALASGSNRSKPQRWSTRRLPRLTQSATRAIARLAAIRARLVLRTQLARRHHGHMPAAAATGSSDHGPNPNMGAESTLAYLASALRCGRVPKSCELLAEFAGEGHSSRRRFGMIVETEALNDVNRGRRAYRRARV